MAPSRVPKMLVLGTCGVAVLLWLLGMLDTDLGTGVIALGRERADTIRLLLDWTAAVLAAGIALLATARTAGDGGARLADPETTLLALGLPAVAVLDALAVVLTLSGDTNTGGSAGLALWSASRLTLALGLGLGALLAPPLIGLRSGRSRLAIPVLVVGSAGVAFAIGVASGLWQPRLAFVDSGVNRPLDLIPLFLFAIAGLFVLPHLHRIRQTLLSHALIVSTLPQVLAQIEAAFGSSGTADGEGLLAHLLRLLGYACLLIGLLADEAASRRTRSFTQIDLETAQRELTKQTEELERVDRELVLQESKRRSAERSLRMLEKAVATMSIGVTITDPAGTILYVNPADAHMHGYEEDELLGHKASIFGIENARAADSAPPFGSAPWPRETSNRHKNGDHFPVRLVSDAVRDAQGEIIAVVTTCEDITERKHVEQMKQDFISTVSHELRTPLTSIIASLGLLESGKLDDQPTRARELIDVAHRNSGRLLGLINELLDLQKLAAGKLALAVTEVEVEPVVDEVVSGIRALADKQRVTLVPSVEPAGLRARADRRRLVQVMLNLVSNAIKFSPEGASVQISARSEGERVELAVADQGPGIPPAFRDRIFEKFSQANAATNRPTGGSGLGLSIVKELVTAMGGTIRFETELGQGTTFFVALPRANAEPARFTPS